MGLFSFLQSRPGRAVNEAPELSETYQGYRITPCPRAEGGQFRLAAMIHKGEQEHYLIRADLMSSREECVQHALRKARTLIDQQGDRIFAS